MANGIRTDDPRGFNKGRSYKFREGSEFDKPLKKPEDISAKRCRNNHNDEDNCPKTLNDKNQNTFMRYFGFFSSLG